MDKTFKEYSKFYKPNQILVCEERKKKLKLETKGTSFYRIKIDKGVARNHTERKCDFVILEAIKEHICIYVELKGKKLKDAFEQIIETYNNYDGFFKKDLRRYVAIVISKYPKQDTSTQVLKARLMKIGFKSKDILKKENLIELFYDENDKNDPIKMK
ncbi:hypothetical protein QYV54_001329 [Campylobacter upsaliensis]|nr:hypothetical protein [Campylobacter upsaliensis]